MTICMGDFGTGGFAWEAVKMVATCLPLGYHARYVPGEVEIAVCRVLSFPRTVPPG